MDMAICIIYVKDYFTLKLFLLNRPKYWLFQIFLNFKNKIKDLNYCLTLSLKFFFKRLYQM